MIYTHIFLPTSPAISAWCCWWKEVKCNTERSFYYLWKQLLVMQIFFLSYQKIKNSLMRRSTFANILCSVVGGAQIPAVLAAGPSSVTFAVTNLAWLSLSPLLLAQRGRRLQRGNFMGWDGWWTAAAPGEGEGGAAQNPESGSGMGSGRGGRLCWGTEGFSPLLLNSRTWNTKSPVDLCFYRSLWSRLWNKISCGALGGMLYTELINKVSPFSPPVLLRYWKCGYLHAGYAGAKWQIQINTRVLILPTFIVVLI